MKNNITLSDDTRDYVKACWGLGHCEDCDDVVMLWSSGFYEEATYMLMEAGAFCDEGTPPEVMREVKNLYKKMPREEIDAAVKQCLDPKDGDYALFECKDKECGRIHFINSLYYQDADNWTCDSCGKDTGLRRVKK